MSAQQLLLQRTWLVNWSLFVFFNHNSGRNLLLDLFFSERYESKYLITIQTLCPHLMRYLVAALVCNKRRRTLLLKDVVRLLLQEQYHYEDPMTSFVLSLFSEFNFENAQARLVQCEGVCVNFGAFALIGLFMYRLLWVIISLPD